MKGKYGSLKTSRFQRISLANFQSSNSPVKLNGEFNNFNKTSLFAPGITSYPIVHHCRDPWFLEFNADGFIFCQRKTRLIGFLIRHSSLFRGNEWNTPVFYRGQHQEKFDELNAWQRERERERCLIKLLSREFSFLSPD